MCRICSKLNVIKPERHQWQTTPLKLNVKIRNLLLSNVSTNAHHNETFKNVEPRLKEHTTDPLKVRSEIIKTRQSINNKAFSDANLHYIILFRIDLFNKTIFNFSFFIKKFFIIIGQSIKLKKFQQLNFNVK